MAQSYTRQSSFADGDTITAALFNNEYNQLVNAFSYSSTNEATTGHRHNGSAGEGGNIPQIGDLDFLNKIVVDSTNNRWGFYVQVASSAVEQIRLQDGALLPVTDSDVDLGTSSLYFKDAYIDSITTTGNVAVGGNLTVTGTTTFNGGTITMGDAATDNVVFGADVDSNIIPDDDDSYDLGSSSQEWRNLYIDGTANIDSLVADTADINGGTIDGAVIGGSSAAAITGTTITGTAITGTSFVIGSANISEAELEILDGATVTTDELNILDGVTSTTAEINLLDGVTSTTAELNILDGVTSTAAELNILDGVTSTTAELNILDGVTASAADINLIDGITNGTVIASKAIITDANKDITGGRNITITGELDAATLDISGNADIDGTLETDALSINGTTVTSTAAELNLLDGKAFLDEDDMSSNSATGIASQQSIKAYVDSQVTAQDLDVTTDSGTIAIDLDSETLTVSGGTGLDSSATGNAVTLAIDSTVATLTGSQTLTNKTLTSPVINTGVSGTAFLDDDTFATATASTLASSESIKAYVDTTVAATNEVVEDTTPQLGGDLDLNSNDITGTGNINITGTITSSGNITGTLATAAQPNITSVGTLTSFRSTGIDDNADALAITINSSENVGIGTSSPDSYYAKDLVVSAADEGGISLVSNSSHKAYYIFADGTSGNEAYRGWLSYDHNDDLLEITSSDAMRFRTGSGFAEAIRIDSSGNVGIGTSSPDSSTKLNIQGTDGASGAITNVAANELFIDNNGNTGVTVGTSNTGTGYYAFADSDVALRGGLFYDHSTDDMGFRVASATAMTIDSTGIDVTGEVQADTLDIDGTADISSTLSTGNILNVRQAGTEGALIKLGQGRAADGNSYIDLISDATNTYSLRLLRNAGVNGGSTLNHAGTGNLNIKTQDAADIVFQTNNTEVARFDTAGNFGIGTTSPSDLLDVRGDGADTYIRVGSDTAAGNDAARIGKIDSSTDFVIQASLGTTSSNTIFKRNTSAETVRIDSSGNVGIGNSSPLGNLTISNAAGANAPTTVTAANTYLQLGSDDYGASNNGKFMIGFGYTDATNTNSPAYIGFEETSSSGDTKGELTFYTRDVITDTAPTERMRIDSLGNLLVGCTSAYGTTGTTINAAGLVYSSADGDRAGQFDRTTSDGELVRFSKAGTTVGSIGTKGGDLTIGTGVVGLRFHDGTGSIRPITTVDGTVTDDTVDLGTTVARFDDIYATNATIQTSDRNEKQDIEDLTDAETRVAVAAKGLLRKFKWKSAVASKGDNARIHFGIIAQDLQDAFTAEGLDAGDYAMFISNTWTDDDGVEQTRLGVRYSELLAFIIAAI